MNLKGKVTPRLQEIIDYTYGSYDSIEIYPGNNLNLIIGPNGTGKSTIVCAVLLVLGGKLNTLGRADRLSSYIKSGCDESHIEIELYGPNGCNIVISRKILLNNQSEFVINGKISSAAKVNEIRKKYNIQVDNLCTFLPQEKVQDFAKLNPQQLLDQTQRTVGSGELVELHDELKKLQSIVAVEAEHNCLMQNELDNEKQKNKRLEDKIKCFKEKQSLCDKLVSLNQKKAWLEYQEEVNKQKDIEKDCKMIEETCKKQEKEIQKCNAAFMELEKKLSGYQKKLSDAKTEEAGKRTVLEDWIKRAERRIDQLEDLKKVFQSKINEEKNKKKEMLIYKENVEKLTNDLKTLDEATGSEIELFQKKEEVDKQLKQLHMEETRLNQIKGEYEDDEDTLKHELRITVAECQSLKKRVNIRLEYLKRHEPDVYKSMEWLEKNRHLFQSHIYNPMLLELDVPNPKMAKFVEARLGYKDLISFTCTNPDDLNLLISKLRTEQKLKVNAICSDEYETTQYLPDIPINDLKSYGFYAYMKELITGPEDIIRLLCKTYKIHCVPVGDERVKANCGKIPKNIPLFYSDNHVFTVKYSIYSGDKSISVKKLSDPKFFVESLHDGRIKILTESERNLELKIAEKQKKIRELDHEINQLRKSLNDVKNNKRQIGTSAEERQQIQLNLKRAVSQYNSIKESLRDPLEIELEAKRQREMLNKEIQRNLGEIKRSVDEAEKKTLARQICELQFKVNRFGKKQLKENKDHLIDELSRKEKLRKEIKDRLRATDMKCLKLKEKAVSVTESFSIEEKGFSKFKEKFEFLPNTIEAIEAEIEETQAKADFLQGGNIQVLREYEKREETIFRLTTNLEKSQKSLMEKKAELNTKRDKWLDPVNELVSNINVNFGRFFEAMGCAGEVCLVSGEDPDDFDKYGIKVFVKFRDGAPLQELGRFFQSGGERAVATAIFMLSLQELTSVPFRFVDEINQGMDPINERRILQLIVHVTSSEHSTQYFFITPKLLSDIECSETMTVHCIYNGPNAIATKEWSIEKFFDFANIILKK